MDMYLRNIAIQLYSPNQNYVGDLSYLALFHFEGQKILKCLRSIHPKKKWSPESSSVTGLATKLPVKWNELMSTYVDDENHNGITSDNN